MREILFRGKSVNDGEWAYGSLVVTTLEPVDDAPIKHYHIEDMTIGCFPNEFQSGLSETVDPNTVGQFTGLTDKNGKKIFEGDIVVCRQEISGNWIDYCVEIGFVEMKHGAFGLHRKQGYYRPFKDWLEDYEYEVIGNIHDNPELLENP